MSNYCEGNDCLNTPTAQERIKTAVSNIMSGDNRCGTLAQAVTQKDRSYFERAVSPIVQAYEEEAAALRLQRDRAARDGENKRFALEMVVSNVPDLSPAVQEAIARALPGRRL